VSVERRAASVEGELAFGEGASPAAVVGSTLAARRSPLLFTRASQVVTCAGPARARRGGELRDAGVQPPGTAVAVSGSRIAAVGPLDELAARFPDAQRIDCGGRLLTPGLVDSHTHAIFGRARYEEQEMRAAGLPYQEIAARGGGIHSSVRDLRRRDEDALVALALPRLRRIAAHGTTTVEVKSGYGLSVEDELKTLRVIRRLQQLLPMRLVPTWLGAHEVPLEYRARGAGGRAEYLRRRGRGWPDLLTFSASRASTPWRRAACCWRPPARRVSGSSCTPTNSRRPARPSWPSPWGPHPRTTWRR
jgi:hypothetical protein